MEDVTNKQTPSGGVTIPIVKFTDKIIPKWIGSMPAANASGKNNGVKIDTALIVSMNVPAISKMTFINKSNRIGLSATGPSIFSNWFGIELNDKNQINKDAAPIKKIIVAVVFAVEVKLARSL